MRKAERRGEPGDASSRDVFINCPFDDGYGETLFPAIVFTIVDLGFVPRCALEDVNAATVRIDKILVSAQLPHLDV